MSVASITGRAREREALHCALHRVSHVLLELLAGHSYEQLSVKTLNVDDGHYAGLVLSASFQALVFPRSSIEQKKK